MKNKNVITIITAMRQMSLRNIGNAALRLKYTLTIFRTLYSFDKDIDAEYEVTRRADSMLHWRICNIMRTEAQSAKYIISHHYKNEAYSREP